MYEHLCIVHVFWHEHGTQKKASGFLLCPCMPVALRQRLSLTLEQAFSQPGLNFASSSVPPVSGPGNANITGMDRGLASCVGARIRILISSQHFVTSLQALSTPFLSKML